MSLRSLLRASALYTVGNVAPRIGQFLLLPVYIRFLTQADYGTLALLTSLAGILTVVYHFGIDGALMRLHFDTSGREREKLYGTAALFTLALAAAGSIVLAIALGPFFGDLFAGTPFFPLGALALLIAFVGSLSYVPSTLFRASGQPGRFLLVSLGAFVVSSLISVSLVVLFGFGAAGVLTGQVLGGVAVFIVALAIVRRARAWMIDGRILRDALGVGLPLLPHAISAWALRLADRWLIALLIGLPAIDARAQIGIYSVGYQLGYVVSIIVTSFNSAWSPYFYRIGHEREGPRIYVEMVTLVTGGLLVLAVGMAALAPEIVAVIARPGYEPAADVVPVVAFASALQGLYVMFVTVLFLVKHTQRLALITLTAALANIAMNVVLIPPFGIMGAAWATLAAYALFAATTYLVARRIYPIRLDVLRLAILGVGAVVAALAGRIIVPGPSVVAGFIHLGFIAGYVLLAALVCRVPFQRLRLASAATPVEGPA